MNDTHMFYAIILAISGLVALLLTFYMWKRRNVPGASYISLAFLGAAVWSFSAMNEVFASSIASNIFWSQVCYIGLFITPLWFLFAVTYTQNEKWINKSRVLILMVIPAIVLLMVFTNQWHGLVWPQVTTVQTASGTNFIYSHGIGVWIAATYSYLLMIMGMILLLQTVINSEGLYRHQAGLLLVGAIFPLFLNAVYLENMFPVQGVDPTPFGFFITVILSAWSIFKFQFLEVMPVAHTTLFKNMEDSVVVLDVKNKIVELNPAAEKLLDVDRNVLGQSADSVMERVNGFTVPDGETQKHYETRLISSDGACSKSYWLDVKIKPIHSKNSFLGHLISLTDITRTKMAEERAQKAVKEKELLMRETHHRVKNNLMVISSLLNLQSRYVKDEDALNVLKESRNRANSMALIHERLYSFSDLKNINFGEYVRSLVGDLFKNYAVSTDTVKLELAIEDVQMDVDTAIPIGLILNELVSNSLKYAFPAGKGTLKIVFKREDENLLLSVKDDGVGISAGIDIKKSDTLGLTLIRGLVEQIGGKLTVDSSHGTEVCVVFQEKKP